MKNSIYLFAFLGVFASSCSEDADPIQACNVDNVLDLPWFVELTEDLENGDNAISMGKYDSQTVFVTSTCCANCNTISLIYDCAGNSLGPIGSDAVQSDEITDLKVIWKSADDSCGI